MSNVHKFLTYSEINDNDIHKGVSIDMGNLTLEEIQKAIKRQLWIKEHKIRLSDEDEVEVENLKDFKERVKNSTKEYLGTYDIPYLEIFRYKIIAKDWEDARDKFMRKLLENENISKEEYDSYYSKGYNDENISVVPLWDIEIIE